MSAEILTKDERAILVALNNNGFDVNRTAKDLRISVTEVTDFFDFFKHLVRDGRIRTNWITASEIAGLLGCGKECAIALLVEYDHLLVEKMSPKNQLLSYYPPVVVSLLKPYFDLSEDGVDWYTVTQIRSIVKKDFNWTRRQVALHDDLAKLKVSPDGKLRLHYPESVVIALTDMAITRPQAGEFLHVAKISRITGVNPARIRAVITEIGVKCEVRHVPHYGPTECYPPEILDQIAVQFASSKPQGDWLTVNEIAQELNETHFRIKSLIKGSGLRGQKRLSAKTNRVHTHYSPRTLELLRKIVEGTKPHNGWFTSESIQKICNRSHFWVRRRLKNRGYPSEIRVASNNVPSQHYPPWVAYILYIESRAQ